MVSTCVGRSLFSLMASGFHGWLYLKWSRARLFPGVCWQPPPLWKVGLQLKGLEPEPSATWHFSFAQWPSPFSQGIRSKRLEQEPWESWVPPGFLLHVAGTWGLGVALLCWFHFSSVSLLWLKVESGQNVWCHTTELAHSLWEGTWSMIIISSLDLVPLPSVWAGMYSLAMAFFSLELSPFPPKCEQQVPAGMLAVVANTPSVGTQMQSHFR